MRNSDLFTILYVMQSILWKSLYFTLSVEMVHTKNGKRRLHIITIRYPENKYIMYMSSTTWERYYICYFHHTQKIFFMFIWWFQLRTIWVYQLSQRKLLHNNSEMKKLQTPCCVNYWTLIIKTDEIRMTFANMYIEIGSYLLKAVW